MSKDPRAEFELTESELAELLEASRPTAYLVANGVGPSSPQENANAAWCRLGRKRGFDGMSVEPVPGKGDRFFTAVTEEASVEQYGADR